jgi:hypothetical protein
MDISTMIDNSFLFIISSLFPALHASKKFTKGWVIFRLV